MHEFYRIKTKLLLTALLLAAGLSDAVLAKGRIFYVESTPTISNGVAYTSGDQVGGIQTLTVPGKFAGKLRSIQITDRIGQAPNLFVYIFKELPTVASSDNAAINIAAAELAEKLVAAVSVAGSDHTGIGTPSHASKHDLDIPLLANASSLYVVVKTTSAVTYTGTNQLTFKYGFEWQHE